MRFDIPTRTLTAILVLGLCALAPAAGLAAQDPPAGEPAPEAPPETFSEVVDVHVVSVEVVVTDKEGRPVTDLTRDDFEVFEDGEPVTVTNFYRVAEAASEASSASAPSAAPAAESAELRPGDLTRELQLVVVIDNLQIRPENRKNLFDQLRRYLGENSEIASRISVAVMNRRLQIMLPFTDDLERVYEVLDEQEDKTSYQALLDGERRMLTTRILNANLRRYSPQTITSPTGGSLSAEGDRLFDDAVRMAIEMAEGVRTVAERRYQMTRASIQALGQLCETLGGMPGRKALLYLSDGLPQRPADSLVEVWSGKYGGWFAEVEGDIRQYTEFRDAPSRFQEVLTMGISNNWDLNHELEALAEQASVNRVTFYPISASGRGTTGAVSAEHTGSGNVRSSAGSALRPAATIEQFTRDSSLLLLAEDTGGVANLRGVRLESLLDQMQQDFRSFYSLGYSPPHGGEDTDFHRIEVKLRDGLDYEVRHGEGYRNKNWRKSLGEVTLAAALYGRESNPLGVRLDHDPPTRDGKHYRVPIQIKVPFELIRMVHRDEHFKAQLTLLVLVSDEDDGGLSETRRFDLPIEVPDGEALEAMAQVATFPLELKMNRGRKRIAIGIHDHLGKEISTIKYDLVLGEVKKAGRSRS